MLLSMDTFTTHLITEHVHVNLEEKYKRRVQAQENK